MKKPSNGTPAITFRTGGGYLEAQLVARDYEHESHRNEVARRDLTRYYQGLEAALATVDLTEAEASALCDANNGTIFEHWSVSLLWANVADTPELGAKWGIDTDALIRKIRSWDHFQTLAVVDAIERFWVKCETSTVKNVGLVR